MLVHILWITVGLVVLTVGADLLIRGASRIALAIGISPLVVGLTIVACGTSAPELAVSVQAGFAGQSEIAIGNVVGSNIFNMLCILGLCAIVSPLRTPVQLMKIDAPVMVIATLVFYALAYSSSLHFWEGFALVIALVAYMTFLILHSRKATAENRELAKEFSKESHLEKPPKSEQHWSISLLLCIVGLGFLILGAQWLVFGSVSLAQILGISNTIIGLTIVAAGTSLPEVATSVVATYRGEKELAIGNVIGSNTFNLLGITGCAAMVSTGGLPVEPSMLWVHIPVMVLATVILVPMMFTGKSVNRWEGVLLLLGYVVFNAYIVMDALSREASGS